MPTDQRLVQLGDAALICTCFPIDEGVHDKDCELWESDAFKAGLLDWDPKALQLQATDVDYYTLTEQEIAEFAAVVGGPDDDEKDANTGRAFVVTPEGTIEELDDNDWDYDDWMDQRLADIEAAKESSGTKDKAQSAFDKLRAAAKGVADKVAPKAKPVMPECTCTAKDKDIGLTKNHPMACELSDFGPWMSRDCEWDHKNRRLLWYKPEQELVSEGKPSLTEPPYDISKFLSAFREKQKNRTTTYGGNSSGGMGYQSSFVPKCRHYAQPVVFPDGTTVYASSRWDRKPEDPVPDYALYVDSSWRPTSFASFLPWRDHGMPTIRWDHAVGAIVDAFNHAREGWSVEIGCIGGHGRTGSVLACMAILAGVPADDACQWVWDHYCVEAIEADSQIWWIEWFGSQVSDHPEPLPPTQLRTSAEPPPPPKKYEKKDDKKAAPIKVDPDPDIPTCHGCGHDRPKNTDWVCSNSKCRPNYTISANSPRGEAILTKWAEKNKKLKK